MYETEDSEDSNSEKEIGGIRKWMPVQLPEDFDPNKVPTTGEEYLHYAMYEASKCESVITAKIDTSKYNQLFRVEIENCAEASKMLLPTQAWQKQKVAEFTEFRDYIQSKLPPRLSEGEDFTHIESIENMEHEYPKFSVLNRFSAYMHLKLLELIIKKLEKVSIGNTMSDAMGVWIHGILSLIKIPLSPSLYSAIRALARQCALIRSRLPEDAPPHMYNHLNFFICIIGIYFKQFDLADSDTLV